jgi:hypothetical protein
MDFYMDYAPFSMPKVMRTAGRSRYQRSYSISFDVLSDPLKVGYI